MYCILYSVHVQAAAISRFFHSPQQQQQAGGHFWQDAANSNQVVCCARADGEEETEPLFPTSLYDEAKARSISRTVGRRGAEDGVST